jgi:hypothetical protein
MHEKSQKHSSRAPNTSQKLMPTLYPKTTDADSAVKKAEIELSLAITCHASIRSIDHISEIVKRHGEKSTLSDIKLHRTKCTGIIKNIIAASFIEELKNDLEGKKYVLLIDESTDIATQKHLCIVVRYLNNDIIKTSFLGLIPVTETTGEAIFKHITDELAAYNQSLDNCIGFASDGAAAMVGCNNSVWTRIKSAAPNCVQMKCVCHSLALCIQHAFSKLPSSVGFILTEVPLWFAKSSLRREDFKAIFNVMNSGPELDEQGRDAPLPFQKLSKTRWLVRGKVLNNILMNWEELLGYFMAAENAGGLDVKYKARIIKEMLQDRTNYLYFTFATPVVQEFERLNSLFQQTNGDPYDQSKELSLHRNSLFDRIYNRDGTNKMVDAVEFGMKFNQEIRQYLNQPGNLFSKEKRKKPNTK